SGDRAGIGAAASKGHGAHTGLQDGNAAIGIVEGATEGGVGIGQFAQGDHGANGGAVGNGGEEIVRAAGGQRTRQAAKVHGRLNGDGVAGGDAIKDPVARSAAGV